MAATASEAARRAVERARADLVRLEAALLSSTTSSEAEARPEAAGARGSGGATSSRGLGEKERPLDDADRPLAYEHAGGRAEDGTPLLSANEVHRYGRQMLLKEVGRTGKLLVRMGVYKRVYKGVLGRGCCACDVDEIG